MRAFSQILCLFLLMTCASNSDKKNLSQKELDKLKISYLKKVRPLLISDDFAYMDCESVGKGRVSKTKMADLEFWKQFGLIELREKAVAVEANVMSLKHTEIGGVHQFDAEFFECKRVRSSQSVDHIGMCKPSEERLFKLNYSLEESRAVGEEIIRQVIKNHAISKYYKTYNVGKIKYSFTNKMLEASAKFFECY